MSAIRLNNGTTQTAEFRLSQGVHLVARLGVHAGASASVPTHREYNVQAFTTLGEFSLSSNTVSFTDTSADLLAQLLQENGYYDFQLVLSPGTVPNTITLRNTCPSPVQFKLMQSNSPLEIATVADEHTTSAIGTAQTWTVYAIVNGITTPNATITDPNASVNLTADNENGFTLQIA